LSLYWPGMTTRGAVVGAIIGLVSSVALTVIGPQVWVDIMGFERALFPYNYPALFTMPLALTVIWLVSLGDRSDRAGIDRDNYQQQLIQSEFGRSL